MNYHTDLPPNLAIAASYAEATRKIPQVPIAPAVGVTALRLMEMGLFAPEEFAAYPASIGAAELDLIRAATDREHHPRRLPPVPDAAQRRALGFVTTSILTSADQLALGTDGVKLPNIHKPTEGDPAIARATAQLGDPAFRGKMLGVLESADETLRMASTERRLGQYRAAITGIATRYGAVGPEDGEAFVAKLGEMNDQRVGLDKTLADWCGKLWMLPWMKVIST
jgi:hypothetical protein